MSLSFFDKKLWGLNVKKLPWFRVRWMCYGLLSDRLHLIHLSLLTDYIRFAKRPDDILNLKSLRWEMSFDPCDQRNTILMWRVLHTQTGIKVVLLRGNSMYFLNWSHLWAIDYRYHSICVYSVIYMHKSSTSLFCKDQ